MKDAETKRFLARLAISLSDWEGIDLVPFTECLISSMSKKDVEEIVDYCNQQLKEKSK